jgi:competence ComEA-like helix-hairpin-helix protein
MRCHRPTLTATIALSFPLCLSGQTELPQGPGREAVKKICGNCHEIETVISSRRTRTGWQQITDNMISRGAEGTDEEIAAVVTYLTVAFGKINVNSASEGDLQRVLGISEKEARAIASYRNDSGKIKNFDELEKVPGIDVNKLRGKRSFIAFSQ